MTETPSDIKQIIKNGLLVPWFQVARLIEEFHIAKQREKGISQSGRPDSIAGRQGWGIRDSARELGLSIGRISEDILLSRAIRSDSSLIEIRERKDALIKVKENGIK
jgi:hypothetical protein